MHESYLDRLKEISRLDFSERKIREKELTRTLSKRLPVLDRALTDQDVRTRRTAVEILRRLGSRTHSALDRLARRLPDEPDVKTRRRIASALGNSGRHDAIPPLIEQLRREEHRFVQASLILALGNLGFSDWPPPFDDWRQTSGPVAEALAQAGRKAHRVTRHPAAPSVPRPTGTYAFVTIPGAAEIVRLESERAGLMATPTSDPAVLEARAKTPEEVNWISRLTTIQEDYHIAASMPTVKSATDTAALLKAGTQEIARHLPPALVQRLAFRLGLPPAPAKNRYVKQVRSLARMVESELGWINNPFDYELNLQVMRWHGSLALGWRHSGWETPRDEAGRLTLPASISPAAASIVCHVAVENRADLVRAQSNGCRILDLCCGAGTLLREWLGLFPQSEAIGTDKSGRAIEMARSNLAPCNTQITLRAIPFQKLPADSPPVDFILVNPPFGQRVKSGRPIADLYRDLFEKAAVLLKPTGSLVLYTGNRKAVQSAFRRHDLPDPAPRLLLETGGRTVGVYRFGHRLVNEFVNR